VGGGRKGWQQFNGNALRHAIAIPPNPEAGPITKRILWQAAILLGMALAGQPAGAANHVQSDEIRSGGPPPDGIPAIRNPKFDDGSWLRDTDIVTGLTHMGEARAYPWRILVWHEIANDEIQGLPVAVTYCPLCGTGIAFDRRIDDEVRTFIVSGQLYKNDLVMMDTSTRNLWSQLAGSSLGYQLDAGGRLKASPVDGTFLTIVSSQTTTWEAWKRDYPHTVALSRDTGFDRDYDRSPYRGYEDSRRIGISGQSRADVYGMHPKEFVVGLRAGEESLAIRNQYVQDIGVTNFEFSGTKMVAAHDGATVHVYETPGLRLVAGPGSNMTDEFGNIYSRSTGRTPDGLGGLQRVVTIPSFWFAWIDFYPKTLLIGALGVRSESITAEQGSHGKKEPIRLVFTAEISAPSRSLASEHVTTLPAIPIRVSWADNRTLVVEPAQGEWPMGPLEMSLDQNIAAQQMGSLSQDVTFAYEVAERSQLRGSATPGLPLLWIVLGLAAVAATMRRGRSG
jgi:hypothetical protein